MAITLRNIKGIELSYLELDTNFTEFYYSSSIDGHVLNLNKFGTGSFSPTTHSLTIATGSTLTLYSETGSTGTVSGSLTVTGTVTAQEFFTEITSASIIYTSGSTKFGDTQDDKHEFTGSIETSGSVKLGDSISNNHYVTGSFNISGSVGINGNNITTGSLTLTNTGSTTFTVEDGYVILTEVSESLNFPSDASASAAGVPLGGLYRNGNAIYIKTT